MTKEEAFVNELIGYIFAYPEDDYMTMECLCRKLHKHGLIDKKDGEWTCNFIEQADTPQTDMPKCRNERYYKSCEYEDNCNPTVCFKALDEFQDAVTDCDHKRIQKETHECERYVITNDEGEKAYGCMGCQTDCPWK